VVMPGRAALSRGLGRTGRSASGRLPGTRAGRAYRAACRNGRPSRRAARGHGAAAGCRIGPSCWPLTAA